MKIYSVYDPEFKAYGQVVTGLDQAVAEIVEVMKTTPLPEKFDYVCTEPALQNLPAAVEVRDHCFGGMPTQLGWCNGHNTKLNCLEYHRDSEFSVGVYDYILMLGRQSEIENGMFDTAKVKAFRVPAGVMVEVFATTLHYAPCHTNPADGFKVMCALPWLTNTERPDIVNKNWEDEIMAGRNKWLLVHPESDEAKKGAKIALCGENLDMAAWI